MKTIYEVSSWSVDITEIKIIKETEYNYWSNTNRMFRKNTTHEKHFENKEDAVNYIKDSIETKINTLEYQLERERKKLDKFKQTHNIQ